MLTVKFIFIQLLPVCVILYKDWSVLLSTVPPPILTRCAQDPVLCLLEFNIHTVSQAGAVEPRHNSPSLPLFHTQTKVGHVLEQDNAFNLLLLVEHVW